MTDPVSHDPRPLDDVLLAMDVVDTLRHREQALLKEMDDTGRESQLIERLREIYAAQGIEVPDRVIKEGVQALKEKRFAYAPPTPSLSVRLARLYVTRDRWMGLAGFSVAAVIAALSVYQFGIAGPAQARAERQQLIAAETAEAKRVALEETLPGELNRLRAAIGEVSQDPRADALAASTYQAGVAALDRRDADAAQTSIDALEQLRADLAATYDVRVVYGPDEPRSGITRLNDDAPGKTNYYLIVEAVAPGGGLIARDVTSQETRETERTARWAQQVSEEAFYAVAADKSDDMIIQNATIGAKAPGRLDPVYTVETTGGAILEW